MALRLQTFHFYILGRPVKFFFLTWDKLMYFFAVFWQCSEWATEYISIEAAIGGVLQNECS